MTTEDAMIRARSARCGACTAQMDYVARDQVPGYVIDGPDGRRVRVCGFSCELELITGENSR